MSSIFSRISDQRIRVNWKFSYNGKKKGLEFAEQGEYNMDGDFYSKI